MVECVWCLAEWAKLSSNISRMRSLKGTYTASLAVYITADCLLPHVTSVFTLIYELPGSLWFHFHGGMEMNIWTFEISDRFLCQSCIVSMWKCGCKQASFNKTIVGCSHIYSSSCTGKQQPFICVKFKHFSSIFKLFQHLTAVANYILIYSAYCT